MSSALFTLNAGSSTLKFAAFSPDGHELLLSGQIDHYGAERANLQLSAPSDSVPYERCLTGAGCADQLAAALATLAEHGLQPLAVAHRIVHGGSRFTRPILLDGENRAALAELVPLAPLHQPVGLAAIDTIEAIAPALPQIACFDTAFHAGMPELAQRFAVARHWHDKGVRRYGFHGLSYAAIARRLPELELDDKRVVVCHLGSGASACALLAGQSVASSMGFSALDGLMMGTRPGTLDAEVVLYWQEHAGLSIGEVRDELYKRSGLLGVSELSADIRPLLASHAPAAHEAVALFCYRVATEVGRLAAAMQGLDAVVFTAGIGEHAPSVRAAILHQLGWLGFRLDEAANDANATRISQIGSTRSAWVIPTDEEGEIARLAAAVLAKPAAA
ncbi:acetate/propionate family kinase [Crenobacter sp. SG2305]|uniref:acetate/propionate family kinase n=1 Tax=Crenobacter oryzisoli TaxID=3056844 RepID=UPI0025AA6F4B|nr:acetate/propionate family kinase [Crenobacter sp. SG2305]MDN0084444.1 acetate/propionate family kinase [Crenobacter sp. SG2305]